MNRMKLTFAIFISSSVLLAADPQTKPAAQPPAKVIKPVTIPAGAVEHETGRFYYTDPQGKKWIYTKTPFGVSRMEDRPADADAPKPIDDFAYIKMTEEGDIVKFERPGPFGVYKWQKKKSELDEKEKAALQKSKAASIKQDK